MYNLLGEMAEVGPRLERPKDIEWPPDRQGEGCVRLFDDRGGHDSVLLFSAYSTARPAKHMMSACL